MAALVQAFPQQPGSSTMLQTRPSSSSGPFPVSSQPQQHQPNSRNSQMARNMYHGGSSQGTHRGHQTSGPVAPYAFTSTPGLSNTGSSHIRQNSAPFLRTENRTTSAPSVPQGQHDTTMNGGPPRLHLSAAGSVSTSSSSTSSSIRSHGSKDDSAIPTRQQLSVETSPRPLSVNFSSSSSLLHSSPTTTPPVKALPDRYRRGQKKNEPSTPTTQAAAPSSAPANAVGSDLTPPPQLYSQPAQSDSNSSLKTYQNFRDMVGNSPGHTRVASADAPPTDKTHQTELAKRYRRRSVGSLDTTAQINFDQSALDIKLPAQSYTPKNEERLQPETNLNHKNSSESLSSTRSSTPSTKNKKRGKRGKGKAGIGQTGPEIPKRLNHPSPLSKPMNMTPEASSSQTPSKSPTPAVTQPQKASPAAQHLTDITKKDQGKSGKSRLRRAFSFGSAAELRRVSVHNNVGKAANGEQEMTRRQQLDEELGREDAAIAEKQEAAGLGESIYSGQGNFFTGSTDNLSVSSTASSASIMLRKMGKGVKKSTRSLVGLFRPKSVVSVSGDLDASEASVPQVSMVTVEAEREKVNVNADPHEQNGGGTGYPKLERNSMEAYNNGNTNGSLKGSNDNTSARKSIVGGERERAEVLAAVRKGILKSMCEPMPNYWIPTNSPFLGSGTGSPNGSPVARPTEPKGADLSVPNISHINESPHSSVPSTPDDNPPRSGHRRTDSVTIEGEDYFMSMNRFSASEAKSAPITPQTVLARNISFSPRIQFHDTFASGEYDRRGEVATCNRLTPLLAQQIKEELNTFKMEMEVHESSKVYTHFF
ncbi:bud neck involved protein [Arachnomyces sp. PD_36]|nr:bud neck involved protein [Arachnomyces sp. PD_36]